MEGDKQIITIHAITILATFKNFHVTFFCSLFSSNISFVFRFVSLYFTNGQLTQCLFLSLFDDVKVLMLYVTFREHCKSEAGDETSSPLPRAKPRKSLA